MTSDFPNFVFFVFCSNCKTTRNDESLEEIDFQASSTIAKQPDIGIAMFSRILVSINHE
jgi:hypothetical protein